MFAKHTTFPIIHKINKTLANTYEGARMSHPITQSYPRHQYPQRLSILKNPPNPRLPFLNKQTHFTNRLNCHKQFILNCLLITGD